MVLHSLMKRIVKSNLMSPFILMMIGLENVYDRIRTENSLIFDNSKYIIGGSGLNSKLHLRLLYKNSKSIYSNGVYTEATSLLYSWSNNPTPKLSLSNLLSIQKTLLEIYIQEQLGMCLNLKVLLKR